jgi:hypothetical protein
MVEDLERWQVLPVVHPTLPGGPGLESLSVPALSLETLGFSHWLGAVIVFLAAVM